MSYNRKPGQTYGMKRPSFKQMWEIGIKQALAKAESLQRKGWKVDVQGGALTARQAENFIKNAKMTGLETQDIPVVLLNGEKVQFVAYKPKPGFEEAAPPTITEPKPKNRTSRKQKKSTVERFNKMFWSKKPKQNQEEPDGGTLMDPARTMCIVTKNASPQQSSGQNMVKLVHEVTQNLDRTDRLDYSILLKAQKRGKQMKGVKIKYISFNNDTFSLDLVKKALLVLGTKKNGVAMHSHGKPLVIQNPDGDSVLIAPASTTSGDPQVLSISTLKTL